MPFLCNSTKKRGEILKIQCIDKTSMEAYYIDNW